MAAWLPISEMRISLQPHRSNRFLSSSALNAPGADTNNDRPGSSAALASISPPKKRTSRSISLCHLSVRIEYTITSRDAASLSGFDTTNTAKLAGWSCRCTIGKREITFGAIGGAKAVHQAPLAAPPSSRTRPRSPLARATASMTPAMRRRRTHSKPEERH